MAYSSSYKRRRSYGGLSAPSAPAKRARRQAFARSVRNAAAPMYVVPRTSVVAAEKKGMDTDLELAGVLASTNTNGAAFVLNLVQQGAGSWNRVGRKIIMTSARLRGEVYALFTPQATTADRNGTLFRMVVVYDKQPSGASIPTFDTIFGYTRQTGTEESGILAPVRYDNMSRFTVIRDKVVDLNQKAGMSDLGTTNQMSNVWCFDEFIKLPKLETVYSGQTNPMTIADISTGALYVYFRKTNANNNVVNVSNQSDCRLRYYD